MNMALFGRATGATTRVICRRGLGVYLMFAAVLAATWAASPKSTALEEADAATGPASGTTASDGTGPPPPPKAAEFIGRPEVWSVHLSPDGESLAWAFRAKNEATIAVLSLKNFDAKAYALGAYRREYVAGTRVVTERVVAAVPQIISGPTTPLPPSPPPPPTPPPSGTTVQSTQPARIQTPLIPTRPIYRSRPVYGYTRIERDIYRLNWCNPQILLLSLKTGLSAFSLEQESTRPLFGIERNDPMDFNKLPFDQAVKMFPVVGSANHVYIAGRRPSDNKPPDVWKCNVEDGRFTPVARNPGAVKQWLVGSDERTILGIGEIEGVRHAFLRSPASGKWEPAGTLGPVSDLCRVLGYDASGGLVHALRYDGDRTVVSTFDLGSRTWIAKSIAFPSIDAIPRYSVPRVGDIDLCAPVIARGSGRLLGLRVLGAKPVTAWIDPYSPPIRRRLIRPVPA